MTTDDLLELQQAMHLFGQALIDPFVPFIDRINQALTRICR